MASYAATFKNIQDVVIAKVNLDAVNDLTNVKAWINWALTDVCNDTEALQTTGTLVLTPGTFFYDLSTVASGAILHIKAMYVTSSTASVQSPPLVYISIDDMLRRRVAAGGTVPYTGQAIYYTLDGLNRLELYPTPSAADTITFYYSYLPTLLSADSDLQPLGEPWSKMLEMGALAQAADFTNDPAAGDYESQFQNWKMKFRAHLGRRLGTQQRRLGGDLVGSPYPHDPSTDLVRSAG